MVTLSVFSKVCQKSFSLADIVKFHKYQVLAFVNVSTTRKRKQGSGKFMIWKVLIVKWRSFQFPTKFGKNLSRLHLKEISPAINKTLVLQN